MEVSKHITMAENFIANYGVRKFTYVLKAFTKNISNADIALKLEVSRQRVHQWKRAFVKTTKTASVTVVKPEIAQLL